MHACNFSGFFEQKFQISTVTYSNNGMSGETCGALSKFIIPKKKKKKTKKWKRENVAEKFSRNER